jgi:hypothetical protein
MSPRTTLRRCRAYHKDPNEDLAKEDVDDLLRKRLVPGDPGRHARQVIPEIAKDGLEIGRSGEVLPLVETDVLDPLTAARDVGQRLVGAAPVLVVNLAEVDVVLAVEPHADLGRRHIQVEPELVLAVLPVLLLALDDHE